MPSGELCRASIATREYAVTRYKNTAKVSRSPGSTNYEDGQDRYCEHLIFGDGTWQNNTTPSLDLEKIADGTSPMLP